MLLFNVGIFPFLLWIRFYEFQSVYEFTLAYGAVDDAKEKATFQQKPNLKVVPFFNKMLVLVLLCNLFCVSVIHSFVLS